MSDNLLIESGQDYTELFNPVINGSLDKLINTERELKHEAKIAEIQAKSAIFRMTPHSEIPWGPERGLARDMHDFLPRRISRLKAQKKAGEEFLNSLEKKPIANRKEKIAFMKSHNEALGSIINSYEKIDAVACKVIAESPMSRL